MTNRQPAGVPTGGQYAPGSQGRADLSLGQQVVIHEGPDGESFDFIGAPAEVTERQAELASQGVDSTIAPLEPFAPTAQERVDQQQAKKAELAAAAAHFDRMTAQTIADVIRERYPTADRLRLRRVEGRWRPGAVVDAEDNRIETVFDDAIGDDTVQMLVDDLEHDVRRSAAVTYGDDGFYVALDTRHGFWDEAVTYGPRPMD